MGERGRDPPSFGVPIVKVEGGSLSRLLIPYIFIGIFLLWRMKHERGMSEVMHLELIVNSITVEIVTVNTSSAPYSTAVPGINYSMQ